MNIDLISYILPFNLYVNIHEPCLYMLSDEIRYKLLKHLEENPEISQRQLAESMGISLGKANYCLKALIEKGLVKTANFQKSKNKKAYAYFLTPMGIHEKAQVTVRFLKRKQQEYDELFNEITTLKQEVSEMTLDADVD